MALLLTVIQLLAVWIIVPLGLGLIPDLPGRRALARAHPMGALLATGGLLLPAGPVAAGLAAGYGVWCLAAAASGLVLLRRLGRRTPHAFAPVVALLSLPVAALGMVASRGGWELFGFELIMLTLTSVHFHFAGFTAALLSGLTTRAVPRWWTEVACAAVLVSPALVGAAFFSSPSAQLPGVVTLSAGVVVLAIAALLAGHGGLRRISALAVLAPMLLAVWWTAGLAFDLPHLSLAWTAATHGVLNAAGYALCGLLGWYQAGAHAAPGPARLGDVFPAITEKISPKARR